MHGTKATDVRMRPAINGTNTTNVCICPAENGTSTLGFGVSAGAHGSAPGGGIGCPVKNGTSIGEQNSHPNPQGRCPILRGTATAPLSGHPGALSEAAPAGGNAPGSRKHAARVSGVRTATLSDSHASARAPPARPRPSSAALRRIRPPRVKREPRVERDCGGRAWACGWAAGGDGDAVAQGR